MSAPPQGNLRAARKPPLQRSAWCQNTVPTRTIGMSSDPRESNREQGDLAVATRHRTKRPTRYSVVLHNDDYTTMEFVVGVLMRFFAKSETEATQIMLEVHHKGRGVAGTYLRDIAESKVDQVERYARENGHPLKLTAEPLQDADAPGGVS